MAMSNHGVPMTIALDVGKTVCSALALLAAVGFAGPIAAQETSVPPKDQQVKAGQAVFSSNCSVCHQATGAGIPGAFPPLAKSDFLLADTARAVGIVLYGKSGPITVNGNSFNSVMPPQGRLSDQQIADVLTYVSNSWGNTAPAVSPVQVQEQRALAKAP